MNNHDDTSRNEPSGADRPATPSEAGGAPNSAGYAPPAWPPSPKPWLGAATDPARYPGNTGGDGSTDASSAPGAGADPWAGVPLPPPWTASAEAPQYRRPAYDRPPYEAGSPAGGQQSWPPPAYGAGPAGAPPAAAPGYGATPPYGATTPAAPGYAATPAYGAMSAGGAGTPPYGYGGNPPGWGEPWGPPPPNRATRRHRARTALVAGVTVGVLGVAAAGVVVGHAAWPGQSSSASAVGSNSTGSGSTGSGSTGSGSSGLGSGSSGLGSGSTGSGSSGLGSGSSGLGSLGSSASGGSSTATGAPSNAAAIAAKVDAGLVDINTTLGYQGEQAAGTGMVLTSNGEILTNNHVIDGATSIRVTDIGNGKTYDATVVGYDRTQDVAVLQLTNASGLKTVTLGNSSTVVKGQAVVGVGNAGGAGGTPSYAGGQVTALGQSITASDQGGGNAESLTGLIETNANIQPGDSGGSLVNTSGQVIGMDTAAASSAQFQSVAPSTSYAIPINSAVSIAKQIESGKGSSVIHIGATPLLGVEVESAGQSSSAFGGTSSGSTTSGAVIAGVVSGSPAANAGLAQGDTITGVGGQRVTTAEGLTTALGKDKPGDSVPVTYVDANGQSHTVTVHLTAGPPQ